MQMKAEIRRLLLVFVTIPAGLKLSTWLYRSDVWFSSPCAADAWTTLQDLRVFHIEYDRLFAENYTIFKYGSVFCVKPNSWEELDRCAGYFSGLGELGSMQT